MRPLRSVAVFSAKTYKIEKYFLNKIKLQIPNFLTKFRKPP